MLIQPTIPTAIGASERLASRHRLHDAVRVFRLLPVIVFLVVLTLLASTSAPAPTGHSYMNFLHVAVQAAVVSLASCVVSVAAYGFCRYLLDRPTGL
jgi:hypothetical protein